MTLRQPRKINKQAVNQGALGGKAISGKEYLLKQAYNFRTATSYWTVFLLLYDEEPLIAKERSRTSQESSEPTSDKDE